MKSKIPPFIEIYRELIATPSVSATEAALDQSNAALIALLAGWFKDLGFNVEVQPVPGTRKKLNLLARAGSGTGGLLLAGHTDTVPFDDGRWTRDPFTLTEHDNKLYGLGAADMKGFFAFILDALRDIDVATLKRPLYILATADEETTMAGARYFAKSATIRPDCAIIGEPTSLQPVRAHKGHISNAVRILGQSGHSSDPARGVNAIELMHAAIGHILTLRDSLKARYRFDAFTVPYPTLNLGAIHGGDASNRICACCEMHMDIRPLPGMTLSELDGLLNEALAPVSERWPGRLTVSELHPPIPGYECPPDNELVQVVENLLGVQTEVVNYCTEAPFIQNICPTLVLGPGSINQAHQPDEYLETRFIKPTRELIHQVVRHFCWH
ncbi:MULTISPECIES: acetylornithine deacetylase [Tenebrionibacter/Tenebrionicola group]|uniref:Acetylornithine deacetylase n=2 Tax=Tenebrionibacter/Tenebrionicola group TaxID=2969848 RepID=A0A8K0V3B5_9ENTR|nr:MULTISPECIES: acetylornithine deacetylase [Tenebrionibacter/Tenebrionicola group]MBK4716709.1 acetylornithine deacetylase [Tenebrionibacter intestinalis]MBV5096562.1 acetylornithine deacetylase [Tenebrionicola larvae]